MNSRFINYFGYGVMASPILMESLLGRKVSGKKATLNNFGLISQGWSDLALDVKEVLMKSWSPRDKFRNYSIKGKRGSTVSGKVWRITKKEHQVIGAWNVFDKFWYEPFLVELDLESGEILAETEAVLTSSSEIEYLNGENYRYFLNDRDKVLSVATTIK